MDAMQLDHTPQPESEALSIAQRIQQLAAQNLVKLMDHTGEALEALSHTPSAAPQAQAQAQLAAFQTAMNNLLTTLHTVDVHMKRQILGLKEAGIIVLDEPQAHKTASLNPNGVGAVGKLDAGWLNSRSAKVEREMEAELWAEARQFLQETKLPKME
ncbi:hypothetical protein TD95_003313 [Thielaviopsis punctulata]|uniref:Mediator of RNA polymerase II transcription subunit 11 n=1 Tax=Thielaviopsis punctulata TaxID=72032 RepID=A0A0F4ZDJ3_9PEZI|nr:hypothetical protein TD95_003313 [Thielaviopsis punctulata]